MPPGPDSKALGTSPTVTPEVNFKPKGASEVAQAVLPRHCIRRGEPDQNDGNVLPGIEFKVW